MKPITGQAFARLVEARGWRLLRVHDTHHISGKEGEAARLSDPIHGHRPLKTGLQRHLAKLAGLTDADLD